MSEERCYYLYFLLLFLAQYSDLRLFVLVQEEAYRSNNENAIFYQLCFYHPNIPEKIRHKIEVSASATKEKPF